VIQNKHKKKKQKPISLKYHGENGHWKHKKKSASLPYINWRISATMRGNLAILNEIANFYTF
jgi:hypothetical protein